jgi:hypothetical protein
MKGVFMKKFLCAVMACAAAAAVFSCTTIATSPFLYTNNTNSKFEILGEVVYESADRTGFTELLREARNLYPDCDYVIDIMVDRKDTTTKFFVLLMSETTTWVMRGTAIKYTVITPSQGF